MISRGGYHKFSVSSVFSHRFRSLSRRCIRNFASQIEGNQNHHNEEDPQFLAEVKSTNQNFMKPISHINRAVRNSVMGTNFMNYKNLCIGFDNLETQVRSEIEREARENRPQLLTLPRVSSILNGLRLGELTIFTGPTGCGKTTVLSQISLDYCMQGVKVIWGSFEVRNTRLSQIMLQQIAMQPIISDRIDQNEGTIKESVFNDAARKLRRCQMMFLDMFGSTGLDTVLEALKNTFEGPKAINPHLVILDNLQFMLSGQASNSLDRWDLMDRAISSLRSFCNTFPVHVILVVHPRKEIDDTLLCLASVSGTAKATQEADNVIILQKIGSQRFLDIRKNRFHGELGRVPIEFNIQARMVSEMKDSQKNTSMSSNTTQTSSIHNVPENNPKEYPVIDEFPKLLTLIEE